jgi:hypothetical protein
MGWMIGPLVCTVFQGPGTHNGKENSVTFLTTANSDKLVHIFPTLYCFSSFVAGEPSPVLRVVEKWCRSKEETVEVEVPNDPIHD